MGGESIIDQLSSLHRIPNYIPKSPKPSIPDEAAADAGAGAGVDEVGLLKKSASSPIYQLLASGRTYQVLLFP